MRLKKLIIHGFKSFANRVEVCFDGGITGVVGPNGCGKSNIADAVRWVLGEQSAKELRGSKMEDVIFGGTEKRRRLAFCEVTLIFDNADRTLPIDFAEVEVTRRAYRSGESEYSINHAACRLKDIVDLFRDTGIGRDGYSIIGQGRIDEILSAKSEDRRAIFEEAAGIVKYKARKLEAERRMERTHENLERVEDILTELQERVGPLKAQSEVAREYLALRDELKVLDLNVFLARTQRYQARIEELQGSVEELRSSEQEMTAQLESAARQRDAQQLLLNECEAETAEKRDAVQELIRETEASEGTVKVLKERLTSATRERDRIISERDAAANGREGIEEKLASMTVFVESETQALREAETAQTLRERELTAAEQELGERERYIEEEKADIIRAMGRLSDVKRQQGRLVGMQASLRDQLGKMGSEQEREQRGVAALDEHVREARALLSTEQTRREELTEQSRSLEREALALTNRGTELNGRVSELAGKRQKKGERLKLLRELQKDYDGYNNSVKQVLRYAGRLSDSGVHGVVANVIRVPERLERAIDMVLGGALQNVVVDREENAKRMIEYLRSNNMGRATFLPISSVNGRTLSPAERHVLSMPGCVGLASELIEFDGRYQGIIDSLLGRTVVAEDLDSGIAIQKAGRHQFRLVTLAGDVMHAGGSMTGGSVQSRMSSLLSRSREIEETGKQVEAMDAALLAARKELEENEEKRRALKKDRNELYEELRVQEGAVARAEAQLKAAEDEQAGNAERVERAEQERIRLEGMLKEVNEQLAGMQDNETEAEQDTEERKKQVKLLQDEIFVLRERLDALRKGVTDGRVSVATRRRGLEARRSERDRFEKDARDSARLLAESAEKLTACEEELSRSGSALQQETTAWEAKKAELDRARAGFNEAEARRTSTQKSLRELSETTDTLRDTLGGLSERTHRAELQLARVEGDLKQINDRIWEEYELSLAGAEAFRRDDIRVSDAEKRTAEIRARIKAMGSVNVGALDEYRTTAQRVEELSGQRDDLVKAEEDLQRIVEELEGKMETRFAEQFAHVNENFKANFSKLFGGGRAELQLSDPKDALGSGIEIVAQPPGKKLQMLSLLSGGERALTAIAILFAILDLKPSPFCILDEIEAALDDANIDTYADYLKDYSRDTQFIVITHRKGTMERCDSLYGVMMEEKGVSRTVSVKLDEALA